MFVGVTTTKVSVFSCFTVNYYLNLDYCSTEYDDVYGASYGASHDDREMCVSPGTMAQFTFSRRLSEEEKQGRRTHLDSITEADHRDYDVDMDGLNIEEDEEDMHGAPVSLSEYSSSIKVTSMKESVDHFMGSVDCKEASGHLLRPLMIQPKARKIRRKFTLPSKIMRAFSRKRHSNNKEWFIPVNVFMKDYVETHSYWFDFSSTPIRFPLNSNAKG
jgi:hypothetical protein